MTHDEWIARLSTSTDVLDMHERDRLIRDALTSAIGWSESYRAEVAFAKRYAGTPFFVAAWEHLERATTVTGPRALKMWAKYREVRDQLLGRTST